MKKKAYVTTAIPYVNAAPHVGSALDYLLADIWARYQKQTGEEVRFQVGTDEHGNKIASKALAAGLEPKAYVDQTYLAFKDLMTKIGTSYTDFVRTTDEHHVLAVQEIWRRLKPYIYKNTYEGWYCEGCEAFVSDQDAAANNGVCPDHNAPYKRLSEQNYFFKASTFSDQVREAVESDRIRIVPEFRKREFLELMKDGLQDVSISRPRKSLSWGIVVPDDDTQVMYVWLDALSNYITTLGYPDDPSYQEYWPADLQVVGKDILRFHAGLWPAILLGLDLPLPKCLLVHGHINVGGVKMSKSIGNVVDPNEIIDNYGVDAFRYYFARHIPSQEDGDFTWQKFEDAYNNELANDLGNLVQRVAGMVTRYQAGVIGDLLPDKHDMGAYNEAMCELNFDKAFDEVWAMVRSLNRYIDNVKPWEIASQIGKETDAEAHLSEVLVYASSALVQIGRLLVPFLPDTSQKIIDTFASGSIKPIEGVLFPKIYKHSQTNSDETKTTAN